MNEDTYPLLQMVVVNMDELLAYFPKGTGGLCKVKSSYFCQAVAIASGILSLAAAESTKRLLLTPETRPPSLRDRADVGICIAYRAQADMNYEAVNCVVDQLPSERRRCLTQTCRIGSFTAPGAQSRTLDVTILSLPLDANNIQRFHLDCRRLLSLASRAYHSLWMTTWRGQVSAKLEK